MKLIARLVLVPVRLVLGLPPVYGLTIKSRCLMLLRNAGLYRGRIDFVCKVRPIVISATAGKV